VTTDNASNNSTMLHALEDLIKANHPNSRYSAQFGHIRYDFGKQNVFADSFFLGALPIL
jgi:hypothetical protein